MKQMDFHFAPALIEEYETCREFIAELDRPKSGKTIKEIAADMDMGRSQLTRKLNENENDTSRFTLLDLEKYLEKNSKGPLFYLLLKHLSEDPEVIVAALNSFKEEFLG